LGNEKRQMVQTEPKKIPENMSKFKAIVMKSLHGVVCSAVIGDSNSLATMQLIERSNQMNYFLSLLYFHDYFSNQMI
jgi:hypothetical protein